MRTWTPFWGTANPQFLTRTFARNKGSVQGCLTPTLLLSVPSTSEGSDGRVPPSTSSGEAEGILQAALAGCDPSSSADFGHSGNVASSDLMGVARVTNIGQLQHRVGPG